ncbi:MAG: HD domain-containing protein, partial [Myxococcaceae bacterium]
DEWLEMRRHPEIGFQMIQNIPFLSTPADIVLSHQERFDGAGYPRNLQRNEIHIGARIFAVADTLDAMTSDRPYRKGTTFANAIQEIKRCANTQFDPDVVKAFLDIGEEGLIRIKKEMAEKKLNPMQAAADAAEAETELARLTDLDDEADSPPVGPASNAAPAHVTAPIAIRSASGTEG